VDAVAVSIDVLVAAGWLASIARGLRPPSSGDGAAASGSPKPAWAIALLVVVATSAWILERQSGGVLLRHPALVAPGLLLVLAGARLHAVARRALGPFWSTTIAVRSSGEVVQRGPYAVVRHPVYLSVLLMALGTIAAHPSVATGCATLGLVAGIALKIRLEERALQARLGRDYAEYAARTPALLPRLRDVPRLLEVHTPETRP